MLLLVGVIVVAPAAAPADELGAGIWKRAEARAGVYREAMQRADRVLQAWLKVIDPKTGLTPERYRPEGKWTVANAAADMYSSLVMIGAFTDRRALNGPLRQALVTEKRHALRIGTLPDDLDIKTLAFVHSSPSLGRSIFGASEWCRDGLLRITEILGPGTPWSNRLIELTDGIMARSNKPTKYGLVPGRDHEIDGEMLQTLSRIHALTGEEKYRAWARRIGEYHLFDDRPQDATRLRLRDHGGEIISGLSEFFVMTSHTEPARAARYRKPLRELLDRVLEIGRKPDGMLCDIINPRNGTVINDGIIDTWGYIYNSHLTYDMVTGENRYRDRITAALESLPARYMGFKWETTFPGGGSDDYADSIESALVLDNRLHVAGIEAWIVDTIPRMWAMQEADGTVNRLYDDGSFGRTSILVAGLMAQGVRAVPWRSDLRLGAVERDGRLYVLIDADRPWVGQLLFDRARWREVFHLPINYPRINELPEWYVVSNSAEYEVTTNGGKSRPVSGATLTAGLPVRLDAATQTTLVIGKR